MNFDIQYTLSITLEPGDQMETLCVLVGNLRKERRFRRVDCHLDLNRACDKLVFTSDDFDDLALCERECRGIVATLSRLRDYGRKSGREFWMDRMSVIEDIATPDRRIETVRVCTFDDIDLWIQEQEQCNSNQ